MNLKKFFLALLALSQCATPLWGMQLNNLQNNSNVSKVAVLYGGKQIAVQNKQAICKLFRFMPELTECDDQIDLKEIIHAVGKNDIDQGIMLEQHLPDIIELVVNKQTIKAVLQEHWDKQQKIMGMIECAHFLGASVGKSLIQYALDNALISQEILELPDNTIKSFCQVQSVYKVRPEQTLKIVQELLPKEQFVQWLGKLNNELNSMQNDIKTEQLAWQAKRYPSVLSHAPYLSLFTDSGSPDVAIIQRIKRSIEKLSLPEKISLIVRLNEERGVFDELFTQISSMNLSPVHLSRFIVVPPIAVFFWSQVMEIAREYPLNSNPVADGAIVGLATIVTIDLFSSFYRHFFRPFNWHLSKINKEKETIQNLTDQCKDLVKQEVQMIVEQKNNKNNGE